MEPSSLLEYLGEVCYDIKSLLLFLLNLSFLSGDLSLVNIYEVRLYMHMICVGSIWHQGQACISVSVYLTIFSVS